jgi:hypothetical protein
MSIVLLIARIIGIVLLVILLVVIALILAVLFVPVRYSIKGSIYDDNKSAIARASWFFHIVSASASYDDDGFHISIKLFCHKLSQKAADKELYDDEEFEDIEDIDIRPDSTPQKLPGDSNTSSGIRHDVNNAQVAPTEAGHTDNKQNRFIRIRNLRSKIKGLHIRLKSLIDQIRQLPVKVHSCTDKVSALQNVISDERNKLAISLIWDEIKYLLSHFRFRRFESDITFSLGDPALTGQVLGALSMIPVLYQKKTGIYPDFTSDDIYVKGIFLIKGRARLIHVLMSFIRLIRVKEVRRLIKLAHRK